MPYKKVLVIGGNGFIGYNLLRFLATRKDVMAYSFDLSYPFNPIAEVTFFKGDFFNDADLELAIKGMDVVVHALSTVTPGNSNKKFLQGYQYDFIQTVKLCQTLIEQHTNLIFLSSGGTVYGNQFSQPILETALPVPINHYGSVKLCIETAIRCFNAQLHTKMRIARISNPYGPGQDYHKGVGFIDAVIKKSLNNEVVEIWGDGENIRDYIYITDVCKMLWTLIQYEGEEEVFNIGSGVGVSQNEVIELVTSQGLSVQVIYKDTRSVDVKSIILDNSKIKTLYNQEITFLKAGIANYLRFLANNC